MKKYFVRDASLGDQEFSDYDAMIDAVRRYYEINKRHPEVIYGELVEFEPAEIVKSWKAKNRPDRY